MERVLCIDVGGTRIKFAVLERGFSPPTKEDRVKWISTLGWLNASLPELLDPKNVDSPAHLAGAENFDAVAVCLPGEVNSVGEFHRDWLVIPNLKSAMQKYAPEKSIRLFNDGHAWMSGVVRCRNDRTPLFFLGFGTGVAAAVSSKDGKVRNIEFSNEKNVWSSLIEVSKYSKSKEGWAVHRICGAPFFEWVKNNHTAREWRFSEICKQFTARVSALIHDVQKNTVYLKGINQVFLMGGHASYINTDELPKTYTYVTSKDLDVPADMVPLIGML